MEHVSLSDVQQMYIKGPERKCPQLLELVNISANLSHGETPGSSSSDSKQNRRPCVFCLKLGFPESRIFFQVQLFP